MDSGYEAFYKAQLGIKMAEQEEMEFVSPTNTLKIHTHVEQHYEHQAWKKDYHTTKAGKKFIQNQVGWKKAVAVGDL